MSKLLKIFFPVTLLLGVLVGGAQLVSAKNIITNEEQSMFSQNDILFFDPCHASGAGGDCGITVTGDTIEEKIWTGLTSFMTDEQAAGVMGNMAHEGGFNPARHETAFLNTSPNFAITTNTNDSYGIGLIQWSFGRRVKLLGYIKEKASELLNKYLDAGRGTYGRISGKDFLSQAGDDDTNRLVMLELCYLKQELESHSSYGGILKTTTVDEASDYFLERVEIPADIPGQRPIRRADAQKYYNEFHGKTITGSSSAGGNPCNACAQGSLNINGTAVCLAWPLGTDKSVWRYAQANGKTSSSAYGDISEWTGGKATDAFNKAIDIVYPDRGWSQCPKIGASCDVGVGTTIRYSGYDKDWPRGLGEQHSHVKEHPELWETLGPDVEPQAGDVVNSGGHTYIVAQDEKGDFYRVESGLCSAFLRVSGKFNGFESGSTVFRAKKAKNSSNGVSVTNGVTSSSSTGTLTSSTSENNKDVGATARYFAWPENSSWDEQHNMIKPEVKSVWEKLLKDNGHGIGDHVNMGRSCVVFVWGVLRYAGLIDNFQISEYLFKYLEEDPNWEMIGTDKKVSELEDGDVLVYMGLNGNGVPHHYAIFGRDESGGGHIIQASNAANSDSSDHYGVVGKTLSETKVISDGGDDVAVWRNKNNKHGDGNCDVCDGMAEDGEMQLKAGGMTLAEAKEFMKAYKNAAMGKYYKVQHDITFQGAAIHNAHCPYGVMNNCVAFSQWFINKYTTIGPNWNNTTNGVGMVDRLSSTKGLKKGKADSPRPYAIFSTSQGSYAGHTGVVLGVDENAKKIVIGEASCSESAGHLYYEPQAREVTFDYVKKSGWSFAYTDDVLTMGGVLKNA